MKGFTEMTEQEILALTEEDVQKLIKLRMMEEGIKIGRRQISEARVILTFKAVCCKILG